MPYKGDAGRDQGCNTYNYTYTYRQRRRRNDCINRNG